MQMCVIGKKIYSYATSATQTFENINKKISYHQT